MTKKFKIGDIVYFKFWHNTSGMKIYGVITGVENGFYIVKKDLKREGRKTSELKLGLITDIFC